MNSKSPASGRSSQNRSLNVAGRRSYRDRSSRDYEEEEEDDEDPRSKSTTNLNTLDSSLNNRSKSCESFSSSEESLSNLDLHISEDTLPSVFISKSNSPRRHYSPEGNFPPRGFPTDYIPEYNVPRRDHSKTPTPRATMPADKKETPYEETNFHFVFFTFAFAILILLGSLYWYPEPKVHCDITSLSNFSEHIQDAVITALQEIQKFNRPSVLTFIYNNKREDEIDENVQKIVKYTTCMLNGGHEYVEVTRDDVLNPDIIADRGKLITKYQGHLEKHNVMLVKHLEDVPGNVAMAFHFLCDQFTPVVRRALIIFTMKYESGNEVRSESRLVREILTAKWKELRPDNIPALISRLTNAIMKM